MSTMVLLNSIIFTPPHLPTPFLFLSTHPQLTVLNTHTEKKTITNHLHRMNWLVCLTSAPPSPHPCSSVPLSSTYKRYRHGSLSLPCRKRALIFSSRPSNAPGSPLRTSWYSPSSQSKGASCKLPEQMRDSGASVVVSSDSFRNVKLSMTTNLAVWPMGREHLFCVGPTFSSFFRF